MNDQNNASGRAPGDVPPPLPAGRLEAGASGTASSTSPSGRPQPAWGQSAEVLPPGVAAWCWGGFLLNWIWAIRFRVWWGLLALVPFVGLVVPIWLGIKGRELAWRRGNWTSLQAFNDAQRKWSVAGLAIAILVALIYGGGFAYEQWQSHRAEASVQEGNLTQEQVDKILSAPVDLKQLGVPTPGQTAPTVQGKVDVEDSLPKRIETSKGTLELRTLSDNSSALFLGEQRLLSGQDSNWHELVRKFQRPDGSEVVLARSSGGRGTSCEALYFFIVVYRDGVRYSPEFGSCTPAIDYEQRGEAITLTMPRMGGVAVYQFNGDDKVLEGGKLLEMRDDNNPSM